MCVCICVVSQLVGACPCLTTTQKRRTVSHGGRIEIPLLLICLFHNNLGGEKE